jgi:hypothetical protein
MQIRFSRNFEISKMRGFSGLSDLSPQNESSPFVRIALPSSLMLWLEEVPSDGIGITPDLCLATSWLHDLIYKVRKDKEKIYHSLFSLHVHVCL